MKRTLIFVFTIINIIVLQGKGNGQTFYINPETQSVCVNVQPYTISVTTTAPPIEKKGTISIKTGGSIYSYEWSLNGTIIGHGETLTPYTRNTSTTDIYFCKIYDAETLQFITELRASVITVSPTIGYLSGTNEVCYPNTVLISLIGANDINPVYTWYKSYDGTNYSEIPNSNTKQLNVTDDKNFYLKVKQQGNCAIKVSTPILINGYPVLNITSVTGKDFVIGNELVGNLTSIVTGGKPGTNTFKWYNSDNGTNFSLISGQTSNVLNVGTIPNTKWFKSEVTNYCGVKDKVKNVIRYDVINTGQIGDNQTICYNSQPLSLYFKINPSGGTGNYVYQWQVSTDGTNFSDITGMTQNSYQPGNLTTKRWYRVKVKDEYQNYQNSNSVEINVNSTLNPGQITASQTTICYNTSPGYLTFISGNGPSGGNGIYAYQWQESNDGINFVDISGQTNGTCLIPNIIQNKWYRVKVSSCGETKITNIIKITVASDLTVPGIGSDVTICYNTSPGVISLNGTPTGGIGSYSYQWQYSLDGSSFIDVSEATYIDITVPNLINTRWYRLRVTNQCAVKYTNSKKINVYSNLIGGNIGGDVNICYNTQPSIITFTTNPSGGQGNYTYQWQVSNDGVIFTDINGSTSSTYQPGNLTQTKWFRVKVTDGCGTVYSSVKKVNVYSDVSSGTIVGNQEICKGTQPGALYFSVLPNGGNGNFTYQWEESLDGTNFSLVPGATNSSYQPGNINNSKWYRVKVTNTCKIVYTNSVKITVAADLMVPEIGKDSTICYGNNPGIIQLNGNPTGGLGEYTYQWELSGNNITYSIVNGATGNSYEPGNMFESKWFRVKVNNLCESKYSDSIKVTVLEQINGGNIGGDVNICYNTQPLIITFTTNPSGGQGNYTYQWQVSNDGVSFTDINGSTSSTYQPGNLTQTKWFRVKVTDGCGTVYSSVKKVNVYQNLGEISIGNNETICYGTIPFEIVVTSNITGGSGSYSYQWERQVEGYNWEIIEGENNTKYQPGILVKNTKYRVKVNDVCGYKLSNEVQKSVYEDLNSGIIESQQTICYNTQPEELKFSINPSGGSGSYSYQWLVSENASQFNEISQAIFSNYQPEVLENTQYYKVRITDKNGCGEKETNVVAINILPELTPGTIGNSQNICYNSVPTLLHTVNPVGGGDGIYNYQWQEAINGEWVNISGAVSDNYQPDKLVQTKTYRRKVNSYGCGEKISNSITIAVKEDLNPGAIGNNQTIQYNTQPQILNSTLQASGGTGNYQYQWQVSENWETWTNIQNETNEYYQPGNLIKDTQYKRLVIDAQCGSKSTNIVEITVMNQLNAGTIGENQLICNGAQPMKIIGTEASGGTGSYVYSWLGSVDDITYSVIPGANEKDYQPGVLTQTTYYKRKVENNGDIKESNKVLIEVRNPIVVPETNKKGKYCIGENVLISVINVQPNYQYIWRDISNNQIGVGVSKDFGEISNDSTVYLLAQDQYGCISNIQQVDMRIDRIKAEFTVDKTNVKQNEPIQFSNLSMDAVSYEWDFGDGVKSDEVNPLYYYQKLYNMNETKYTVKLKAISESNCISINEKIDYITVSPVTTSIGNDKMEDLKIYPIPFSNYIVVEGNGKYNYEIIDLNGKFLLKGNVSLRKVINTEKLQKGIYLIKFYNEDNIKVLKIIKGE